MRALVQCVSEAQVTVDGSVVGSIGKGYLIFLGVGANDSEAQADKLWRKISRMRVFEDDRGKTNLSLADVAGDVLVVSQFTLFADCRHGRDTGFSGDAQFIFDAVADLVDLAGCLVVACDLDGEVE